MPKAFRILFFFLTLLSLFSGCKKEPDIIPQKKIKTPEFKLKEKDVSLRKRFTGYFLYAPKLTDNDSLIMKSHRWLNSLEITYTFIGEIDVRFLKGEGTVVFVPFFYKVRHSLIKDLLAYVNRGGRVVFIDGPFGALATPEGKKLVGAQKFYLVQYKKYRVQFADVKFFPDEMSRELHNVSGHVMFDYSKNVTPLVKFNDQVHALYSVTHGKGRVLVLNWHAEPLFRSNNQKFIDDLSFAAVKWCVDNNLVVSDVREPISDLVPFVVPEYNRINFYDIYPAYFLKTESKDPRQEEAHQFLIETMGNRFSVIQRDDLKHIPSRSLLYAANLQGADVRLTAYLTAYLESGGTILFLDAPLFFTSPRLKNILGAVRPQKHQPDKRMIAEKRTSKPFVRYVADKTQISGLRGDFFGQYDNMDTLLAVDGMPLAAYAKYKRGAVYCFNYDAYAPVNPVLAKMNRALLKTAAYYLCGWRYPQEGRIKYIRSIVRFDVKKMPREPGSLGKKYVFLLFPETDPKTQSLIRQVIRFLRANAFDFVVIDEQRMKTIPQDSLLLVPELRRLSKSGLETLMSFIYYGGKTVFLGGAEALAHSRYNDVNALMGTKSVKLRMHRTYKVIVDKKWKKFIGKSKDGAVLKDVSGYHAIGVSEVDVIARFSSRLPAVFRKIYGSGEAMTVNWYLPSSRDPEYLAFTGAVLKNILGLYAGGKTLVGDVRVDISRYVKSFPETQRTQSRQTILYLLNLDENFGARRDVRRFIAGFNRTGIEYALINGQDLGFIPVNSIVLAPYVQTIRKKTLLYLAEYVHRGGKILFWGPPTGIAPHGKPAQGLLGTNQLTGRMEHTVMPRASSGFRGYPVRLPPKLLLKGHFLVNMKNVRPISEASGENDTLAYLRRFTAGMVLVYNFDPITGQKETDELHLKQCRAALNYLAGNRPLFPTRRTRVLSLADNFIFLDHRSKKWLRSFVRLQMHELYRFIKSPGEAAVFAETMGVEAVVIDVHDENGYTLFSSDSPYHLNQAAMWRRDKKIYYQADFLKETIALLKKRGIQTYFNYIPGKEQKLVELFPVIGARDGMQVAGDTPTLYQRTVVDHLLREIKEMVSRYNIAGIIIDDRHFSPYNSLLIPGSTLPGTRDPECLRQFAVAMSRKNPSLRKEDLALAVRDKRHPLWQQWLDFHWTHYRHVMGELYYHAKRLKNIQIGYRAPLIARFDASLLNVFDFVVINGGTTPDEAFYRTLRFKSAGMANKIWLENDVAANMDVYREMIVASTVSRVNAVGLSSFYNSPWFKRGQIANIADVLKKTGAIFDSAWKRTFVCKARVAVWDSGVGGLLAARFYNFVLNLMKRQYDVHYSADLTGDFFKKVGLNTDRHTERLMTGLKDVDLLVIFDTSFIRPVFKETSAKRLALQITQKGLHALVEPGVVKFLGIQLPVSGQTIKVDGEDAAITYTLGKGRLTVVLSQYRGQKNEYFYAALVDQALLGRAPEIINTHIMADQVKFEIKSPEKKQCRLTVLLPAGAKDIRLRVNDEPIADYRKKTTQNVTRLQFAAESNVLPKSIVVTYRLPEKQGR